MMIPLKQAALFSCLGMLFGSGSRLQAQTSEWEKDERLQKPIHIEAFCVDMATLCKRLSDSKLVLSPDAECRDQKLQLRITDRSRLAVMKALAELLPGKWNALPEKRGYILTYDPKSLLRRREWWDTYQAVCSETAAFSSAKLLENVRLTPAQRPVQYTRSLNPRN